MEEINTLADLHMHSHFSDGVLAPDELMQLVATRGVAHAALTDHDTTAGCELAASTCAALGIRFSTGVEVSSAWRGQTLHILGLGLDANDTALAVHLATIRKLRQVRINEIGERLTRKVFLPGRELAASISVETAVPTRMHLARALLSLGLVSSLGEAFDRWLASGRPGHVPITWPELSLTLEALRHSGAQIVLAHPHRYKLSSGVLAKLLAEFQAQGGQGMEVSVGGMGQSDLDRLATLSRRFKLAASTGSDFHDPATPWNPPGRFAKLPADLEAITTRL